jgi:hypothetical protein
MKIDLIDCSSPAVVRPHNNARLIGGALEREELLCLLKQVCMCSGTYQDKGIFT